MWKQFCGLHNASLFLEGKNPFELALKNALQRFVKEIGFFIVRLNRSKGETATNSGSD